MDLTPNDVEQKAFTQALRGYQMDEVDDFLDEIVTALRSSDQRLRDAQEKIRALETDAISRGGDETTISRAILVAQRSADALLAEARVDADRIRQTAQAEAESLSAERDMERNRLQAEVDAMRDRVSGLRETLSALTAALDGQVGDMEAEIADAEGQLRPTMPDQAEPTDDQSADRLLEDEDDSTPMFVAADVETTDDIDDHDDQPANRPHSIDLNEPADDDDNFDKEEVVSRVSARPWERG